MRERLLKNSVSIKRKDITETGLSDTGDILSSKEKTIATGIKIRITNNDVSGEKQLGSAGGWMNSSFLGFTMVGNDIKIDDILEDEVTGYRYLVAWVDRIPGGKSDSHYEVYMNDTRNE